MISNPNCTDYGECLIGLYIFFAIMFPLAGLAMYITSLCLRPVSERVILYLFWIVTFDSILKVFIKIRNLLKDDILSSIHKHLKMFAWLVAWWHGAIRVYMAKWVHIPKFVTFKNMKLKFIDSK